MTEMGWCPSGRLFEATACGAAVVTDTWEGIDAFFRPGEIIEARNTAEVIAALEMDDMEISRIAAAGRERTHADHTSDRRAAELVTHIEGTRSRAPRFEAATA